MDSVLASISFIFILKNKEKLWKFRVHGKILMLEFCSKILQRINFRFFHPNRHRNGDCRAIPSRLPTTFPNCRNINRCPLQAKNRASWLILVFVIKAMFLSIFHLVFNFISPEKLPTSNHSLMRISD